jgi:hypothetical protein
VSTVAVGATFDRALYARTGVNMVGSNSADSFDSSVVGGSCVHRSGQRVTMCSPTGNGRIGTEGNLNLHGNTGGAVDGVDVFFARQALLPSGITALTGATGDCSGGCPDLVAHRDHYVVQPSAVCDGAPYTDVWQGQPLHAGINSFVDTDITLTDSSMPTTLAPGQRVILCAKGTLTITGTKGLNMASNGEPNPPGNLLIFLAKTSGSAPALNFANHCEIAAAIYAPDASFSGGAQCDVYGSMIVNSVGTQGGVGIHYDDALGRVPVNVPVSTSKWRECADSTSGPAC